MAIKTILTEPNAILRQISKAVEKVEKEERKLMDDMLETMYSAKGIGLAAIQVGVPKRIIVMDISKDENKKEQMFFVNTVINNKNKNHILCQQWKSKQKIYNKQHILRKKIKEHINS